MADIPWSRNTLDDGDVTLVFTETSLRLGIPTPSLLTHI